MSDTLFKNLLFLRQKRKELKNHIQIIEDGITSLKEEIAKIDSQERDLQMKIIESMKKEGVKTKQFEGNNITQSEKKYIKIVDEAKLLEALSEKYIAPLKRIIGKSYEELRMSLVKPQTLDTVKAREYIEVLTKVEQIEKIEGTELQITGYLVIK